MANNTDPTEDKKSGFKRQWVTIPVGLVALFFILRKKSEAAAAEVSAITPTALVPGTAEVAITPPAVEEAAELSEFEFGPRGEAVTLQPTFVTETAVISTTPTFPTAPTPTIPEPTVESVPYEAVATPALPTETFTTPEVAPVLEVPKQEVPTVTPTPEFDLFTGRIFQLAITPENQEMINKLKYAEQRGLVQNVTLTGTLGSVSYKVIATSPENLKLLGDILEGRVSIPVSVAPAVVQVVEPIIVTPTPPPPKPAAPAVPGTIVESSVVIPPCALSSIPMMWDIKTWNAYEPSSPANYTWQEVLKCDGTNVIVFDADGNSANWRKSGFLLLTYLNKLLLVTSVRVQADVNVRWTFGRPDNLCEIQIYDENLQQVIQKFECKASFTPNKWINTKIDQTVDGLDPAHTYSLRIEFHDRWSKQGVQCTVKTLKLTLTRTQIATMGWFHG